MLRSAKKFTLYRACLSACWRVFLKDNVRSHLLQRFRDIVHTRRSWLVVTGSPQTPAAGIPSEHRQQFTSLAAAVASSRPGDTILVEPGAFHEAAGVLITHPVNILGGGASPETTVLSCPIATLPTLRFGATARLSNLTVLGGMAGCVEHLQGRLVVENCVLRCDARGLRHLAAPVTTLAASPAPVLEEIPDRRSDSGSGNAVLDGPLAVAGEQLEWGTGSGGAPCAEPSGADSCHENDCSQARDGHTTEIEPVTKVDVQGVNAVWPCGFHVATNLPFSAPLVGAGVLSIIESSMEGGSSAVRLRGTGQLAAVRVIYEARKALFWLEVDSAHPGWAQPAQPAQQGVDRQAPCRQPSALTADRRYGEDAGCCASGACGDVAEVGVGVMMAVGNAEVAAAAAPPQPSWLARAPPGFDPAALQARVAAVMAAGEPSEADLEKKAWRWRAELRGARPGNPLL